MTDGSPSSTAVIAGSAVACPPARTQAELWDGYFAQHFADSRWARRVFVNAGPARRHCAVDPLSEDVSAWTTGRRMARYLPEALPLGKSAVAGALTDAKLAPEEVGLLVVASCTGYATPGLDIHLARDLAMPAETQRLVIGHMGCYGAFPALTAARSYVVSEDRAAVVLCAELSSLHLQPPTSDLEQVVAHSLFSDAAAAVIVRPGIAGRPTLTDTGSTDLVVVGSLSRTDPAAADLMTWEVTDRGFRMTLSRHVPDVVSRHVGGLVGALLASHGVNREEVVGWAVHPGGPRILDVVADTLALGESDLAASRSVLREHGNCSSATTLMIVDELRAGGRMRAGGYVVAMAFGPGLTLAAALLRVGPSTCY